MMHRLQDDLNKAQQQKIEAEERADRWEKIKSVRPKHRCCLMLLFLQKWWSLKL